MAPTSSRSKNSTKAFWPFVFALFIAWCTLLNAVLPHFHFYLDEARFAALMFTALVLPCAVYVALIDRQNPLLSMRVSTPAVTKRIMFVGIVSAVYIFLPLQPHLGSGLRKVFPVQEFIQVPMAINEELLFRGFILTELESWQEFSIANTCQALLFSMFHFANVVDWPSFQWSSIVHRFLVGLLMGWLLRNTNSIWIPTAVHAVSNLVISYCDSLKP